MIEKIQKFYSEYKENWLFVLLIFCFYPVFERMRSYILGFFGKEEYSNKILENIFFVLNYKITLSSLIFTVIILFLLFYFLNKIYYFIFEKVKLKILNATYGTDNIKRNITKKLNDAIVNNSLKIQLTNRLTGDDPYEGVEKKVMLNISLREKFLRKITKN